VPKLSRLSRTLWTCLTGALLVVLRAKTVAHCICRDVFGIFRCQNCHASIGTTVLVFQCAETVAHCIHCSLIGTLLVVLHAKTVAHCIGRDVFGNFRCQNCRVLPRTTLLTQACSNYYIAEFALYKNITDDCCRFLQQPPSSSTTTNKKHPYFGKTTCERTNSGDTSD
jgi:hypothetical protein